jgi:hypothetical protein
MERGNTKHGRVHDQQMAHETEALVHGAAHHAHAEEWRETEPVEDSVPPLRRGDEAGANVYELRSELARLFTRDSFPANREAVLARLRDADAPEELIDGLEALPAGSRFAGPRDVLVALGINSPETGKSPEAG